MRHVFMKFGILVPPKFMKNNLIETGKGIIIPYECLSTF